MALQGIPAAYKKTFTHIKGTLQAAQGLSCTMDGWKALQSQNVWVITVRYDGMESDCSPPLRVQ